MKCYGVLVREYHVLYEEVYETGRENERKNEANKKGE